MPKFQRRWTFCIRVLEISHVEVPWGWFSTTFSPRFNSFLKEIISDERSVFYLKPNPWAFIGKSIGSQEYFCYLYHKSKCRPLVRVQENQKWPRLFGLLVWMPTFLITVPVSQEEAVKYYWTLLFSVTELSDWIDGQIDWIVIYLTVLLTRSSHWPLLSNKTIECFCRRLMGW